LGELVVFTRPFLALVSKAKAAKLVRNLVDMFLDLEAGTGEEVLKTSCIKVRFFEVTHLNIYIDNRFVCVLRTSSGPRMRTALS
jgi:hypothetical protein